MKSVDESALIQAPMLAVGARRETVLHPAHRRSEALIGTGVIAARVSTRCVVARAPIGHTPPALFAGVV